MSACAPAIQPVTEKIVPLSTEHFSQTAGYFTTVSGIQETYLALTYPICFITETSQEIPLSIAGISCHEGDPVNKALTLDRLAYPYTDSSHSNQYRRAYPLSIVQPTAFYFVNSAYGPNPLLQNGSGGWSGMDLP